MKYFQRLLWPIAIPTVAFLVSTPVAAQSATDLTGAQLRPAASQERVASDGAGFIRALNAGAISQAVEVLRQHGFADDKLEIIKVGLSRSPSHVKLNEPFLKAAASVSMEGDDFEARLKNNGSYGYGRLLWPARVLSSNWVQHSDEQLKKCGEPPIGVLNVRLNDPDIIKLFQWYDRYAEHLHSVILNGEALTNARLNDSYDEANRTLNALFTLIKARKPDAFVWLLVVKQDNHSDERWLKAMTYQPDGLQISNLRQFHSPFDETRRRYIEIVGTELPMMVAGFMGQRTAVEEKKEAMSIAKRNSDLQSREAAKQVALTELGGVGAAVAHDLLQFEKDLKSLGYRGLSLHNALLQALASQDGAMPADTANFIDSRVGWLDRYHATGDYTNMFSITSTMLTEASPGDLNWTVAKLYEGMALLSQTPPDIAKGNAVLDEVLASDFKGKPGRDHYIIGAAEWRIRGAFLAGNDVGKAMQLARWVETNGFRADLSSAFTNRYQSLLAPLKD